MKPTKFNKVLVANRGEIAIRIFSACKELGIRCVGIYSKEDETSLFRTRADESYLIKDNGPVSAYLNIDKIIKLAIKKGCDAIHPGYGFLSENADFARACEKNGITFIGPSADIIIALGDKINSKKSAERAGVPIIKGINEPIRTDKDALAAAKYCGYPVMVKASAGGGGRGMRIVQNEAELLPAFHQAQSEALKAFGNDDMFIEQYLEKPKHIEVQILGDRYGNIVHLFERDCSIQRRHQKVVEFTPAFALPEELRARICEDAIKIAKSVDYSCAGTVEFLLDNKGHHYFIEVNPRIQVEHTVSELTTGIDLVQSQIRVAEGFPLDSEEINIPNQAAVQQRGFAIQCRVTTEDPVNDFAPDTGKIDIYRTSSGFGIRLDGGNGFAGANISPYYDSLLVKVTAYSRSFSDTIAKAKRALREIIIRGVKTNIGFIMNVLNSEEFARGVCDTGFLAANPELFNIRESNDIVKKIITYIADRVVNDEKALVNDFDIPDVPKVKVPANLSGSRDILLNRGPEGLQKWIQNQDRLLVTDTTMRDAHQSLMATRVRTVDMLRIARPLSVYGKDLFSLEMWGGAVFDVAYRFLQESPWERLTGLRERIPNIMFQMLLRGNNTVGYKNYPDNVVKAFVRESARAGIDIFRVFDSLNWIEGMRYAIEQVIEEGKVAEGTMCYTGDILDSSRTKYDLKYYINKAKEIEKTGCHILGIKDMSALLKPYAAYTLIKALKEEIGIPIHLHTHDTTGNGVATCIMACEAGVDIVDTAFNSMSGLTSQPALNSVVAALQDTARATGINPDEVETISRYWASIRPIYANFESDLKSGTTEIYKYEIPGGQYSNLKPQVESFGLGHKFTEVKEMYKNVNGMLGDIVKVTPSSKMVGDLAIFMVQNELTPENILEKGRNLDFPDSVISYFSGMMGQPEGGFPPELQKMILKGEKPITVRPGDLLAPVDFEATRREIKEKLDLEPSAQEVLSYILYPNVFEDYVKNTRQHGNLSFMSSDIFFHGLRVGQTAKVRLAEGKTLIITLIDIGRVGDDGMRTIAFEVNGFRRDITIKDNAHGLTVHDEHIIIHADPEDPRDIGASIPGKVVKVNVAVGDTISEGDGVLVIEAMKMETNVVSNSAGTVKEIHIAEGDTVISGQLLLRLE
ncbi:MAG: pyruvate carboxylase [Eubacteriales bacterium]|nr:pyruvate carboxylase [Eubacteriales bacterium]